MTTEKPEGVKLSDDQFWALERWLILLASEAAIPGFVAPPHLQSVRDTAFVALTGREPPKDSDQ
jgi:hypothetical protein